MRYFIKFAYNGKNYHGWQIQPDASSVQETLTNAIQLMLKQDIELVGAGRTDAGVHAKEMYAHFDANQIQDKHKLIQRLNSYLPKDIAIYDLLEVHSEAHARFDATKRTYNYHISTRKDVFNSESAWYYHNHLDVELMNLAAQKLFDYIDFQCFSKTNTDVHTYNCKVYQAKWIRNDHELVFIVSADRFLRNMVRAIVGTLVNVGLHKMSVQDFEEVIKSKNRSNAGFSVPAHGLYLTEIEYPYILNKKVSE